MLRIAAGLVVLLGGAACGREAALPSPDALAFTAPAPTTTHPTTVEAFVAELSPLPDPAVLVVYEVKGPGNLQGTLEVMLRAGGFRRENWSLLLPLGDAPMRWSGSTVQTPAAIYVEGPEGRAAIASDMQALADDYLALDPATQERVVATIRAQRSSVAAARLADAHAVERILGIACRPMRLAAQDLCIWEDTGLPLRYAGGGFVVHAIAIDRDPELGASAFAIPDDVTIARAPKRVDARAALAALASGGAPEVLAWMHPGLRLPDPRAL